MSLLLPGTIGRNYTHWDDLILVSVGAIMAIQSVALSQFRQSSYSSEKYTPKWYQRLFFFLVGISMLGWGVIHTWTRGH
jgi:hypothetical protein